ncbi:MAG: glycerol-3-phosphate 1-O-acyltransferase PlsY [Herpetosiphonaceae bacterium]|nr:glycerol-3-phosphate 1-O-acyltransferase PlsY [Herpetosiphonaceae bacterium]
MAAITLAALLLVSYLVGSIPFSFLIAKARGIDLRQVGSGNTGASNVWRNCGFLPFLVALALDMAKGAAPTFVASSIAHTSPIWTMIVGMCAMLGHLFPIFLRFKGGKAVATAGGVLFAIQPGLFVLAALVWTAVFKLKGYPSLASLSAAVIVAVAGTWLAYTGHFPMIFAGYIWVALVLVVYMHRSNIQRLLAGQEMGIGPRTK